MATATVNNEVAALVEAYGNGPGSHYEKNPGFMGAMLLLDHATNRARSITIWQSQLDFDAAAATPSYTRAMRALGAHFSAPPAVETWELAAMTGMTSRTPTFDECAVQHTLNAKKRGLRVSEDDPKAL